MISHGFAMRGAATLIHKPISSSSTPKFFSFLFSFCYSSATHEFQSRQSDFKIIKEGEAEILMDSSNTVFYNKVQVSNRDLSIAVLRTFISKRNEEHKSVHNELKSARVLEALAASGLRAIRYAREIDGIGQVVVLDNNEEAIEACKRNIEWNGPAVSEKLTSHLTDARVYMLTHPKEFDVIDLDPYGSPAPFLDSAVQCVSDGGILMCTATDMAVLSGGIGGVCYSRYGSYPLRGKYCHEMALRILLACIESHANRYKRYIVPVLSVHMDFYIRVFVRIFTSGIEIRNTPLKLSYVYQCTRCDSFHLQTLGRTISKDNRVRHALGFGPSVPEKCTDCGNRFNMGGPVWSAPIHDNEWVNSILSSVRDTKDKYPAHERISAVLTSVSEELFDTPLFLNLHSLCHTVKCTSPTISQFRSGLMNAGYRVSGSHADPLAIKTDAPMNVIWDIMRCWVKINTVKPQPKNHSGASILSREPVLQASFAEAVDKAKAKKTPRFLPNPEKYWGPKRRADRRVESQT